MRVIADKTRLSWSSLFAMLVLFFSVSRGLIPLLTANAALAKPSYTLSFILGILLSLPGLYLTLACKSTVFTKQLRWLLFINLSLHILWWLPIVVLNPEPNFVISIVYSGLFPFAIFWLGRISERHLITLLGILTLLVAGTIFWDFLELNTSLFPNGYRAAVNRQLLLRPEKFDAYGRTGNLLRPVGLLGHRPHDAGNLLAILSVFWLGILFHLRKNKILIAAITAICIIGMLMTQSASNIAAFFIGALFILFHQRRRFLCFNGFKTIFAALLTGAALLFIFDHYLHLKPTVFWQWSQRVAPDADWTNMANLGVSNIEKDFLVALLTGHGSSLGLSEVGDITEIGFVKMLMEYGLIPCAVFLAVLLYPVIRYSILKNKTRAVLPYIAAIIVGFISLWHYGSLLRTTNVFVFLALYARALQIFAGDGLPAGAKP